MNESFMDWIKSHLIIVVGALILGVVFLKKVAPGGSSTAATTPVDTSGLAKDANGNPIVYRDVQDSFVNIYHNVDSNNTTTNTNTTNPVASAPPTTPASPASPVEHPIEAIIRSRNTGITPGYDQAIAGGVPIRSAPSGSASIVGLDPYGTAISGVGALVQGQSNFGNGNSGGSNEWLPVQGGYVSAYDLTGYLPAAS